MTTTDDREPTAAETAAAMRAATDRRLAAYRELAPIRDIAAAARHLPPRNRSPRRSNRGFSA